MPWENLSPFNKFMKGKIVFKVILTGPVPTTDFLNKEVDKWVERIKSSAPKRRKGLKQAIKTPEDWDKKIHQPQIKNIKAMFKDDIVTRKELTKAEMIARAESEKDEKCRKYFKTRQESFKNKSFEKGAEERKRQYERGRIKYFLLYGSKEENVKGLISLGVMALCGDKCLREFVDLMSGNPVCITSAEKLTGFKKELRSKIAHWGGEIIASGYDSERVNDNSQELNRLVDGYRLAEFAPFKPGAASHIDFIVRLLEQSDLSLNGIPSEGQPTIPGSNSLRSNCQSIIVEIPNPTQPGQMTKWLGLDICVSVSKK